MKVVIIGSGNVASMLVEKLQGSDIEIIQIFARNIEAASQIAYRCGCEITDNVKHIAKADLYIVAVSDSAIQPIIRSISFDANAIVVHTAGSVEMNDIGINIKNRGVLYPLQTFSKGVEVDLGDSSILIEASNQRTLKSIRMVAEALCSNILEVPSKQRLKIHIAAVFACNFVNHMLAVSERLCDSAGVDRTLMRPLVEQTIKKALDSNGHSIDMQTGPAVRNDFRTKTKHLEQLDTDPVLKSMYKIISQNIWEISKKI